MVSVRHQTRNRLGPLPRAYPDAQEPQAAVGQAYRSHGHVLTRPPVRFFFSDLARFAHS